jgi:predicted transcriptional regulator
VARCALSPSARNRLGRAAVLGLFVDGVRLSVTDIQERLRAAGNELAYTTVMTVLSRLHAKRLLIREREGRRFLYGLGKRASERTRGIVTKIHQALFRGNNMQPIVALLDQNELSSAELRVLRRMVDAKLKEQKN